MRLRARPLALAGALLVAAESLVAALGGHVPLLAAMVLLVAPGLALLPLLPARARADLVTALAAAPVLGFAASSLTLITVSSIGLPLDGFVIRLVAAVLITAGLFLRGAEPVLRAGRDEVLVAIGLVIAVAGGIVLQGRVISGSPVPGNDWGKYLLYADEIRRQGALLIDNPYWMLGVPFREDPATPAIYGAYLAMTEQSAAVLAHGIWVFAVMSILAVFVLVRSLWGSGAGVVAALLWAVLPIHHDILGWHGLPSQAALSVLCLLLLYCACLLVDRLPATAAVGFGVTIAALAATHRLSLLVGLGIVAVTVAAAFVLGRLRPILATLALGAAAALVLCAGVVYDLVQRGRTFGGTLPYADYLVSKLSADLTARDLSYVFTAAAVIALIFCVVRVRRDHALIPLLGALGLTLAGAYAWVLHLPLAYVRMAYFLPLALVPMVAVALARLPWRGSTVAVGAALSIVVGAFAWPAGDNVRAFYGFVNPTSLRALDAVAERLRPDEVVVTDRCWSFLATWLLHTRTLPALDPADIQPKAELVRALEARSILDGTPAGLALARRLGVRFVLVDPTCPTAEGKASRPPRAGAPAFVSERLVVLTLAAAR
ncbi:MAG: hypothetical protein WKF96_06300 [Solirubrobacteraceae bacterium]